MAEVTLEVKNELGLHARPAAFLVKKASEFASEITISKDGREVNGKSILEIMTLAARKGSRVTIRATGPDEKEALAALAELVNNMADKFVVSTGL